MAFTRSRGLAIIGVFVSLAFGFAVIAFRGALGATPNDTTDSSGRSMGFNDEFSAEHYAIIWSNVTVRDTLDRIGFYEGVFIAIHLLGIWLAVTADKDRLLFWFFALQTLVFPIGLLGTVVLFDEVKDTLLRTARDMEHYEDIPYIITMTHSFWLIVSGLVAWQLHRSLKRHHAS